CVMIITQIAIMGFHDVALKYISQAVGIGDYARINGISKFILTRVGISLTISALILFSAKNIISDLAFNDTHKLPILISIISVVFIFLGLSNTLSFQLQAVVKPLKAIFVLSIGPYLFFSIIYSISPTIGVIGFGIIYSVSCALNCAIAFWWWRRSIKTYLIQ